MRLVYIVNGPAYADVIRIELYQQVILAYIVAGFHDKRIDPVVGRYKIGLIAEIFSVCRQAVGEAMKPILLEIHSVVAPCDDILPDLRDKIRANVRQDARYGRRKRIFVLAVNVHLHAVVGKRLISLYAIIYGRWRGRLRPDRPVRVVPQVILGIQVIVYELLECIVKRREIDILVAYVLYAACVIVRKAVVPTILKNYIFLRYVVHVTGTTFRLFCSGTYSTPVRF